MECLVKSLRDALCLCLYFSELQQLQQCPLISATDLSQSCGNELLFLLVSGKFFDGFYLKGKKKQSNADFYLDIF